METLDTLKERFLANMDRHPEVSWDDVIGKLDKDQAAAVAWMEESGGEPDVIAFPSGLAVVDCAKEAPAGRRSVCYDQAARLKRKKFPPETSAQELAEEHGLSLLDEADYRQLQALGDFDLKTSCWIQTPAAIRARVGRSLRRSATAASLSTIMGRIPITKSGALDASWVYREI